MFFVYVTTPTKQEAVRIAQDLVEKGMVACANILGEATAIFSWEGKVSQVEEVPMLLKTSEDKLVASMQRIKDLHPYECPSISAWLADEVDKDFLKWVETSTKVDY